MGSSKNVQSSIYVTKFNVLIIRTWLVKSLDDMLKEG